MTKQQYFEMCEMMGNDPIEDQIPVELEDLPAEVQTALEIYSILQDQVDSIAGKYEGKNLSNIQQIFDIWEIPKVEHKLMLNLLLIIDSIRASKVNKQ